MASHIAAPTHTLLPADTTPRPGLVARRVAALEARPATEAVATTTPPTSSPSTHPASVDTLSPPSLPASGLRASALSPTASIAPSVVAREVEEVGVDATSLWGEDARLTTDQAAERLRAAMKGIGCNNKEVFRLLSDRS